MFKAGMPNNPKVFGNKKTKGHTTGQPPQIAKVTLAWPQQFTKKGGLNDVVFDLIT